MATDIPDLHSDTFGPEHPAIAGRDPNAAGLLPESIGAIPNRNFSACEIEIPGP